jgi:hypothetical protein
MALRREYDRFWREAKGRKVRAKLDIENPKEFLDGRVVAAYFRRFYAHGRINGVLPTDSEKRRLRAWETGENPDHALVDKWCHRFDLPLWEIEEEACKIAV